MSSTYTWIVHINLHDRGGVAAFCIVVCLQHLHVATLRVRRIGYGAVPGAEALGEDEPCLRSANCTTSGVKQEEEESDNSHVVPVQMHWMADPGLVDEHQPDGFVGAIVVDILLTIKVALAIVGLE